MYPPLKQHGAAIGYKDEIGYPPQSLAQDSPWLLHLSLFLLLKTMFWVYLLLSDDGEVYAGQTGNLKGRLRSHNSPNGGRRYTRGRRWHLLAAKRFKTRVEAFGFETKLKRDGHSKKRWIIQSSGRISKLVARFGVTLRPLSQAAFAVAVACDPQARE
jgi:predicted GIY-YIG superfamily endonuclease